jgi:hypothetical protein
VTPHSGENIYRVKQSDLTKRSRFSEAVTYTNPSVNLVTWGPEKVKSSINFSDSTLFEIYDEFGNIVKKGYSKDIDVDDLKRGLYYLNYDNKMGESFTKR